MKYSWHKRLSSLIIIAAMIIVSVNCDIKADIIEDEAELVIAEESVFADEMINVDKYDLIPEDAVIDDATEKIIDIYPEEKESVISDNVVKTESEEISEYGHIEADGYVESPADGTLDFSVTKDSTECIDLFKNEGLSIPAKYTLSENRLVSSVKNQGDWGTCWAHLAMALSESSYLKKAGTEKNLSETQIVRYFFNGYYDTDINNGDGNLSGDYTNPLELTPVNQGSNAKYTTFALLRWTGAADEAYDSSLVYPTVDETKKTTTLNINDDFIYKADAMHLQNAYWISMSNKNDIKKAVMEYGGVGAMFTYVKKYDSESYIVNHPEYSGPAVYYDPVDRGTNHEVVIVGWDDSFSRNNFKYTGENNGVASKIPENNGAWLIKNSWGESYGDDGYVWISYENQSFLNENRLAFAFDFELSDNYDHNYQYDGSCYDAAKECYGGAAVYTATSDQNIKAVGVGVNSAATKYSIKVYTNLTDLNNPESGTLCTSKIFSSSYVGYYTVKLDSAVYVNEGDTFAVVVDASADSRNSIGFFVDKQQNLSYLSFRPTIRRGETFYKSGNSADWNDAYNLSVTYRIKAYTDDYEALSNGIQITDSMVSNIGAQEFCEGGVRPSVTVNASGSVLREGTDYTVVYKNNTGVGVATAIVKGINNYKGSVTKNYSILAKPLSDDMVTVANYVYDGRVHNSGVVIYNNGKLVSDTSYSLTFSQTPLNAGKYTVTITGKGNYTASVVKDFIIDVSTLNEANIKVDTTKVKYTGKAHKPVVSVMYGATVLPTTDYVVAYSNNIYAGTATITVTGTGNTKGCVNKYFEIEAISISTANVEVNTATYTGAEVKPNVVVTLSDKQLTVNRDYTLKYENNIDVTTQAKVTVTGCGGYSGVISRNFSIIPKQIKKITVEGKADKKAITVMNGSEVIDEMYYDFTFKETGKEEEAEKFEAGKTYTVTVKLKKNYTGEFTVNKVKVKTGIEILNIALVSENAVVYNKKQHKPSVVVMDAEGKSIPKKYYSIKYTDNINAGTGKVTVVGKGDYTGARTLSFTILPKELTGADVKKIKDVTYNNKELKPGFSIKGLTNKKDYTYTYGNNVDVSYGEGTDPVSGAYVAVELSDNYRYDGSNSFNAYFKILPVKINSVSAKNAYYRGAGVQVVPSSVAVKAGRFKLEKMQDYTVSYANNMILTNKAEITVTATPRGNYTGSKTVRYKIVREPVKNMQIAVIGSHTFTGAQQKPEVSVIATAGISNVKLIKGTDYTLSYGSNVNAGTGTVKITAVKNGTYTGSITKKFKIAASDIRTSVTCGELNDRVYSGKALKYSATEISNAVKNNASSLGISSKDYKIVYLNNVNAAAKTSSNPPTVKITGKGNYSGTIELFFNINKASMEDVIINIKPTAKYNYGSEVYPTIKTITYNGKKLVNGQDYTMTCYNNKVKGEATVKFSGRGNFTGERIASYIIE